MNYRKKTIYDISLRKKRVLIRCDFNVPMDKSLHITNDNRIVQTLPTIRYLLDQGASVILCSHLGRPKNGYEEAYSLKPVQTLLEQYLSQSIELASDIIGPEAQEMAARLQPGRVLLLENIRFLPGETKNDPETAKKLAALADIYVNDAFGACHRTHASTEGVAHFLPAVSGLLLKKELECMGPVLTDPKRPFVLVLGGSKVSGKIGVIDNLMKSCDDILIGGGMSYTFTRALGGSIGASLCEEDRIPYCQELLKKARDSDVRVRLPKDNVIALKMEEGAEVQTVPDGRIPDGWMGLDIGPETILEYRSVLKQAGTVVWNGPMGVFEINTFADGTHAVAEAISECPGLTVVGGGDSASAVQQFGYADRFDLVSTGGGASLEFFSGLELPGVSCLLDA